MPCRLSARASGAQAAGDGAPPSDYRAADARDGDGPVRPKRATGTGRNAASAPEPLAARVFRKVVHNEQLE